MKLIFILVFLLSCVGTGAATRCVKASGTITHSSGPSHGRSECSSDGPDWSNVVDGIRYYGVARFDDESELCHCKIISPVITNWVRARFLVPVFDDAGCAGECACGGLGGAIYDCSVKCEI